MTEKKESSCGNWTFLTNHAHVLLCLAADSAMRIRDIALEVGITERAVQRIISELTECGYISIEKKGRNNIYMIHRDRQLKHKIESHKKIDDLINLIYS
ncbi:MAG: winged helix-turn-helix transcriptional regulator [Spirochaetales bacterium]|nr:winged helix-turn-helix transcriptional regulator [Spirochaetales bacterium]